MESFVQKFENASHRFYNIMHQLVGNYVDALDGCIKSSHVDTKAIQNGASIFLTSRIVPYAEIGASLSTIAVLVYCCGRGSCFVVCF